MSNVTPMLIVSDSHSLSRRPAHQSTTGSATTLSSSTTRASSQRPRRDSTRIHSDTSQPASTGTTTAPTIDASSTNT